MRQRQFQRQVHPQRLLGSCLSSVCLLALIPAPSAAGSGWTVLPNAPVAGRHDDVFFVNPDLGWVVNGNGQIHRTTDGGENWELQLQEVFYFRSVGFVDTQKGWVGNLNGNPLLYVTTNSGAVWTPVQNIPPPQPTGICGIWVVNASVVYACGRYDGPPRVIKTTNSGTTWTSSDLSPLATTLIDCCFFDENNGLVVGGIGTTFGNRRAVVLGTTNGGKTWETRHTSTRTGEWCWKISFPTSSIGYVSIENFGGASYFLKTTDGGQTWQDLFFRNGYEEQGIGFATPTLGWIGGYGGPTYESTDGGASWALPGFGQQVQQVNRFRFLSQNLGYAVGETVYKYSVDVSGVSADASPESPELVLVQNHPNPFHGSTAIAYTLARDSEVKATIYDPQGRKIITLLEGRRAAGGHELIWNARDGAGNPVSAGVYFYRLETGRESHAVKKLLLVN